MLPDGSINPGEMTSFNHYALGAVADWMHRRVAGLAPAAPGYRELEVRPVPGRGLRHAAARHLTPYGEAKVSWRRADGRLTLDVTVPVGSSALEHRALLEAADEAGIRPVTALDAPIAGAVGCGLDPLERRVHLVVDVGGGTAEAVAFCYGGVLASRTGRTGGEDMTLAVSRYLRERHQLHVGDLEAEALKTRIAAGGDEPLVVQGRDGVGGRPRLATVQAAEVAEAVQPVTEQVVQALAPVLDDLPPQALSDVMAEGVLVFGGCSLVPGLPEELERALGLPVKLAEEPLTCVAEGAARALRNRALLTAYGRR